MILRFYFIISEFNVVTKPATAVVVLFVLIWNKYDLEIKLTGQESHIYRIIKLFRLEKTFMIIESNC